MRSRGQLVEGSDSLLRLVARSLTLLIPLGAVSACQEPLNETECDRLLDRYVELLAKSHTPDASLVTITRYQKEARELASEDPAFAECSDRVSRREFECAMSAPNADRLEICLM